MIADPDTVCPLQVPAPGLRLALHARDDVHISRQIRERGIWEPFETELLWLCLEEGGVFLDVGANIGYFTVLGAARVGAAGRVFAFEPEPDNFSLLQANIALNGFTERVTAVPAALSDRAGEGRLYLHPDNLGDHQLQPASVGREAVAVPLLRGADYLGERAGRPDLVKIDVQGAELQVVDGLMPLLRSSGEGLRMLVELTPYSLRAAGASGSALIARLETLGLPFAIVDHVEHRLAPVTAAALRRWSDNIDGCPEDQGFMNIFLGAPV